MMKSIVFALALTLPMMPAAHAQDYDWRGILAQSVKVQMEINSEFEMSKQRFVPLHFTMAVPFSDGDLITRTMFPETEGNLAEFLFLSPDDRLLEYVTVSTGEVNPGTLDERMQYVFEVIERQIYPTITPPADAEVLGGRRAEVAGRPAVEFVALFNDPAQGPVAARIVGVIAPNDTGVVFVVQQSIRTPLDLAGPDELSATFAGSMLSSLTFQAHRDASGNLVSF